MSIYQSKLSIDWAMRSCPQPKPEHFSAHVKELEESGAIEVGCWAQVGCWALLGLDSQSCGLFFSLPLLVGFY
jgi:hypothetical protein